METGLLALGEGGVPSNEGGRFGFLLPGGEPAGYDKFQIVVVLGQSAEESGGGREWLEGVGRSPRFAWRKESKLRGRIGLNLGFERGDAGGVETDDAVAFGLDVGVNIFLESPQILLADLFPFSVQPVR